MLAPSDIRLQPGDALMMVDVQNDFLPGGSLAVPAGDEVVAPLNEWIANFMAAKLPVFATRDWHPRGHCSFREQGGTWPAHCVADTRGAEFAAALALPPTAHVVSKATRPETDAYSGFDDTDLDAQLRRMQVHRLFVGGLATDYCVLDTVSDALRLGYGVMLLVDAIRAVALQPGDGERAIAAMVAGGAIVVGDAPGACSSSPPSTRAHVPAGRT
jgi:nicotinamidase-related amidase